MNRPATATDPMGLKLEFVGCSPERKAIIEKAFEDACKKVNDEEFKNCCITAPDGSGVRMKQLNLYKNLESICRQQAVKFTCATASDEKCKSKQPNAFIGGHAQVGGNDIAVCPDAFDPNKFSGGVLCVVLHEMVHLSGIEDHGRVNDFEKCAGCPQTYK